MCCGLLHLNTTHDRMNQTISIMIVLQGAQSKGGRVKSGATRNTSKLSRFVGIDGACSLNALLQVQ